MSDRLIIGGKLTNLQDAQQLGRLNDLLSQMCATLNLFDPNAFALSWLEGFAAGAVIASKGVGNSPEWDTAPVLTGLRLSGLTASQLVVTNAGKDLASLATLTVALGGTGAASFTDNGVIYGNVAAAFGATAEGATNQVLTGSTGNPPAWSDSPTVANLTATTTVRMATAIRRRYYHLILGSANPGASGATWVPASANTTGGWRITNAAHLLRGQVDVHADWDGASDLSFSVKFMVNVNNAAGNLTDTVDLKITVYYKGSGDTATKIQTVEVATVVGQSPQYKQFEANFTIDWDAAGNVIEVGDIVSIILNLETDTSEVDDVVITAMEFHYPTTHIGIEAGDV